MIPNEQKYINLDYILNVYNNYDCEEYKNITKNCDILKYD